MDDLQAWIRGWRPIVLRTWDAIPVDEYHRTEYFNDFMRPQGSVGTLHIRLDLDGATSSAIALGKPAGRGEFDDEAFQKALRLQPHLIRAYRLGRTLSGGLSISDHLARALEASAQAIFVVDHDCVLRHANPAGEALLSTRKGLTVLGGRLTALQPDGARRLGELVAAATGRDGAVSGGSLSLARPGHRFPLALKVAPLRTEQIPIFARPRLALVCATDLELGVRSPEDELIALFGLTPAEARVATAVFQGLSLKEAADQFGVSFNTVRFQYARLAEKTGVTRQAELVKLMMRLAAGPEG